MHLSLAELIIATRFSMESLNNRSRIFNVSKTVQLDQITPVLKYLHWLPVKQRVILKIVLLTYKIRNGLTPAYLNELLTLKTSTRNLRSSDQLILMKSKSRTKTYGDASFMVDAPALWNALPYTIKTSTTVGRFKSCIKTYL